MFINDINFPNEIIEALRNNRLVVFAGAGASVDPPTSLPDFKNLARKIAEGTGETLKDEESCEIFLGYLKSKGIDVNKQAAALLSNSCIEPNKMHEAIVDLFIDPAKVKIVTTNYDQMFEKVLEAKGLAVPVYDAPALPLGNDVDGIVHVHGNVNNSRYMVITDADFGTAYLTEGYATRFLIKLFESYTVLFVGYSYHDTILRYLTRAMARDTENARFIITDDAQANWNVLGIRPVLFAEKEFSKMREGIVKFGQRAKRGLLEWKNQFKEFPNNPPRDLSFDTEIDYCLKSVERARVLANNIHGREWLSVLNDKKIFDNFFEPQTVLSEYDQIWINWIVTEFVGKDDEAFKILYLEKGNKIHPKFALTILRKLQLDDANIQDETYKKYITILEDYIDSSWDILCLIEILSKREMYSICYKLFMKYFEISFVLEKQLLTEKSELTYKHVFRGEKYEIEKSWECCKDVFLSFYTERLLYFCKEIICELYDKYQVLGNEDTHSEPWKMIMFVIEDRENYYKEDPLYLLCNIFCESCKAWEQKYPSWIREFLIECLKEPSVLLRKLALKELRESEKISSCDKFDIFINNSPISFFGGKEQIFLLIADIFNDLTEDRKNRLIDEIEAQNVFDDNRHNEYVKYNWCVWIKRVCSTNARINKLEKEILSRNQFEPRNHPELDVESSSAVWGTDQSPITQEEMLKLDKLEIMNLLNNYNEDPFEGPSRSGMLATFSRCVKENYDWTLGVVRIFIDEKIEKEDVWERLLYGVQESNYSVKELVGLLDFMVEHIETVKDILGLSRLLWEILRKDTIKEEIASYEKNIYQAVNTIWNYRGTMYYKFDRLIDAAINTVLGNILLSCVYKLFHDKTQEGITNDYKCFLEKNLELDGEEKDIALCILAGHFNFFCCRDRVWCIKKFSGILEGEDRQSFESAWEGIVYYSRYLNKDVADIVAPIYLKAVTHIDWLTGEARSGFIDLYLLLLIYVIENPCLEYIPKFYNAAGVNDYREFIEGIEHRLRDMEDNEKKVLWNGWLKQFLINRYENKPLALTEEEKKWFMDWLPELGEIFDEAVEIMCKTKMPAQLNSLFLYRLDESELVLKYPHATIQLLTKLFDDNTDLDYYGEHLGNIYKNAKDLTHEEKVNFEEALLKRNITI